MCCNARVQLAIFTAGLDRHSRGGGGHQLCSTSAEAQEVPVSECLSLSNCIPAAGMYIHTYLLHTARSMSCGNVLSWQLGIIHILLLPTKVHCTLMISLGSGNSDDHGHNYCIIGDIL